MTYQVALRYDPPTYIDLNQLYTSNGFKQIILRHCEYLRERPYETLNGRLLPISLIIAGGFVGFFAATKVAEKFNIEKGRIALQGSGIVVGGAMGACIYAGVKEQDLFFKTWKFLKISHVTNDFVFKKHEKDEFLNQFVDCIHYTPIKVPVRLPTGHLIDLDTLKKVQPDKNGDILCPHTREKLDLKNPNIDLELHTLILKRSQHLLQEALNNLEPDSIEHSSTQLQLQVVEKQLCISHEKHLKGLDQLHSERKITTVELNRLKAQFYQHFGVDPAGKADPENDIEAHAMNFNLNWKTIIQNHSKIIFRGTPPTQFMEDL